MKAEYVFTNNKSLLCKEEVPIAYDVDVAVAGGGPAGIGSAIAAARSGCSTLLIEQYGFAGGMAAYGAGMPLGGAYPAYRTIGGIAEEFLTAIREAGPEAASVRDIKHFSLWYFHDPEFFKVLAFDMLEKANVKLLLHTMVSGIVKESNRVKALIIESKSGRQAVAVKNVIDTTGDADIAAWCGAPFVRGRPGDNATMAVTIPYVLSDTDVEKVFKYKEEDPGLKHALEKARAEGLSIHSDDNVNVLFIGMRPRTIFANNIRVMGVDGTDAVSLTAGEIEARRRMWQHLRFFRKYIPGCENAWISRSGEQLGIRDSRRIVGEETLSTEDCLALKKSPRVILRCSGPLDDVARKNNKSTVTPMKDEKDWYDIPYGCIVPKGIDNLLVAGRSFSSSHLAQAGSRGMALLIGMGHAAGAAASIMTKEKLCARDVDVAQLQKLLIDQGCDLGIDDTRGNRASNGKTPEIMESSKLF